jgi:hypothetical protein
MNRRLTMCWMTPAVADRFVRCQIAVATDFELRSLGPLVLPEALRRHRDRDSALPLLSLIKVCYCSQDSLQRLANLCFKAPSVIKVC